MEGHKERRNGGRVIGETGRSTVGGENVSDLNTYLHILPSGSIVGSNVLAHVTRARNEACGKKKSLMK